MDSHAARETPRSVLREKLHSSLWPVPAAMLLGGIVLAQAGALVDGALSGSQAQHLWWLHSGNGGDARNLLSTLAGALMTIAGVVFSITIVTLTLAATQFGSRLVREYLRDKRTKLAIGSFLLTIVYCLLALRRVSGDMSAAEVPHVTVTLALVLSVGCLLVLVLFLSAIAHSIVADEVIRRVAWELDDAIEKLPAAPARRGQRADGGLLPADFEGDSSLLESGEEGYVQMIDYERLARVAAQQGMVLRLDVMAGEYVCKHGWIGRVHPAAACSQELLGALRQAVVIGLERTPVQDLQFAFRHLVDVALRALSPGINDANTALVVIDRVRGALSRLFGKTLPDGIFRDDAGRCRLLARRRTHADIMGAAVRPIRDAAARQPLVILGMLQALARLAEHAGEPAHCEAIWREAQDIALAGLDHARLESERTAIVQARAEVGRKTGHGTGRITPAAACEPRAGATV